MQLPGIKALNFFKVLYRLAVYTNERRKQIREVSIRNKQNKLLSELFDKSTKRLIIFLVPGADWETGKDKISGGVLSIVSLCEETSALKDLHGAETILCTLRGDHLLLKHETFVNKTPVFRFAQLSVFFKEVDEVTIHIPEFLVESFEKSLQKNDAGWLRAKKKLHINIMNQNISLMPPPEQLAWLRSLSQEITITTAHQKYCNEKFRALYDAPIHKFSVWISPEKYIYKNSTQKENLMVVSPDAHSLRQKVLNHLKTIKGLQVQVIQNLTYEEYKSLISRAKWSLTFGEGLDGYFIEPVFSGAISFAVYNEEFFTPDFKALPTVYPSYELLLEDISGQISRLDEKDEFDAYNKRQFDLCAKYYSFDTYRENIRKFYKGLYTFP